MVGDNPGGHLRWWQGRLVWGMRRRGWWVVPCPWCGKRIELTAREHARVALLLHRMRCGTRN